MHWTVLPSSLFPYLRCTGSVGVFYQMASKPATKALRVLIGGGTGFIGSHLRKRLTSKGHEVRLHCIFLLG